MSTQWPEKKECVASHANPPDACEYCHSCMQAEIWNEAIDACKKVIEAQKELVPLDEVKVCRELDNAGIKGTIKEIEEISRIVCSKFGIPKPRPVVTAEEWENLFLTEGNGYELIDILSPDIICCDCGSGKINYISIAKKIAQAIVKLLEDVK